MFKIWIGKEVNFSAALCSLINGLLKIDPTPTKISGPGIAPFTFRVCPGLLST